MPLPSIFVNIAAYRDTECQWTVKDLFDKARHPERVFVGICWQFIADEDADCFQVTTRPEQCRIIEVDARDSRGACWARAQVQELWRGEDFTFQVDAHMRFVQDWDETLIAMLARCPSDRPVLSCYPASYVPPDKLGEPIVSVLFPKEFDNDGILGLHSTGHDPASLPEAPQPNPFISAGLLFAPSEVIREVPYDPHIYFFGEEISLAVRLWTHGWDIFTPSDVIAFHDYTGTSRKRRHWNDHERWTALNKVAVRRLRHLFGIEPTTDAESLIEIERYGLGTARSLTEYERFAGVDFARRLIGGRSAAQIEAALKPAERRKRTAEVFGRIYASNGWGAAETRSGDGSTLERTATLRRELPGVFDFLGIRTLADAGCGDLNWIGPLSAGLQLYLGLDVVEDLVADLGRRYCDRGNHFFKAADITLDDLPTCDAVLCRDVLTHLPLAMAGEALTRIKASGARYLLATTFERGDNAEVRVGGWHPIDLCAAPFNLPKPRLLLAEGLAGSSKAIGVWSRDQLP